MYRGRGEGSKQLPNCQIGSQGNQFGCYFVSEGAYFGVASFPGRQR